MKNIITFVCSQCGSTNVGVDAWAEWDVEYQEWKLKATFDNSYCFDCDEEVNLNVEILKRGKI